MESNDHYRSHPQLLVLQIHAKIVGSVSRHAERQLDIDAGAVVVLLEGCVKSVGRKTCLRLWMCLCRYVVCICVITCSNSYILSMFTKISVVLLAVNSDSFWPLFSRSRNLGVLVVTWLSQTSTSVQDLHVRTEENALTPRVDTAVDADLDLRERIANWVSF